ncbi:hypothetical protein ACWD5R_17970 [Streptomyces sp. NPDC002514]|uniref:hypothetical protein n=1 Tax=Streptomyces sp. NPDC001270 TaxID=3364554 RepID=UPI0036AF4C87
MTAPAGEVTGGPGASGRSRSAPAGYRAEVRAVGPVFGTAGTVQYVLGAYRTASPVLALRWLCGEALRIADRLDPDPDPDPARSAWVRPAMRTVPVPVPDCPTELRAWVTDPDEQCAARERIRGGRPLVVRVPDAGGTFILSVRPADPPRPSGGRPMGRTTPAEKAAAREFARADKETVIERYLSREPLARIADAYGVTPHWLALRLDEWGVPRRQRYEAHLHRRPARRLFRGRMPRRTRAEVRAAQAEFTDHRTDVITRYQDGESITSLARSFQVSHTWVAERLNDWGVPRR